MLKLYSCDSCNQAHMHHNYNARQCEATHLSGSRTMSRYNPASKGTTTSPRQHNEPSLASMTKQAAASVSAAASPACCESLYKRMPNRDKPQMAYAPTRAQYKSCRSGRPTKRKRIRPAGDADMSDPENGTQMVTQLAQTTTMASCWQQTDEIMQKL